MRGVDECEEGTWSTGSCLCFWNGGQAPAGDPLLVEFAPGVGKGREATGCDQGISVVNTDFTGRIRENSHTEGRWRQLKCINCPKFIGDGLWAKSPFLKAGKFCFYSKNLNE